MNINKILSKLFDWLWKTQGDYDNDCVSKQDQDAEQKRVPIIHVKCGGQVGWYLGINPKPCDIFSSKSFLRMDGTRPLYGSLFKETCPECGGIICSPSGLKRQFTDPLI